MSAPDYADHPLRVRLAAIEHERWSDWQRYMHGLCQVSVGGGRHEDGSLTIPADLVARWERQIATPYVQLSDAEKASDMEQVDRYWHLIEPLLDHIERLQLALIEAQNPGIDMDEVRRIRAGENNPRTTDAPS